MSNIEINSLADLRKRKQHIKFALEDFEEEMKEDLEKILHPSFSLGRIDVDKLPFNVSEKTEQKINRISNAIQIGTTLYNIYKLYKRSR